MSVPDPYAHYEVIGWEQPRKKGGTNHISRRKRTGRVLCPACWAKEHDYEDVPLF